MAKKPRYGECKLCGKYTVLTYEHVPPKSAFNNVAVKLISGNEAIRSLDDDRLPWDISDLHGKIQQKGKGGYYLCRSCNANTGSWFVPYYERFIRGVYQAIRTSGAVGDGTAIQLIAECIRPLPIFKEIMVMFCDINHKCFEDKNLRQFLLEKDSEVPFDSKKYRVFCYIAKGPLYRMNGLSAHVYNATTTAPLIVRMSEISTIPLGLALYIDLPDEYIPEGCEITSFSQFHYEDETKCDMILPLLESNIIFSGDYRTKKEIENTVKQSSTSIE